MVANVIVTEAHEGAGAVVYWNLCGRVLVDTLISAWAAKGFDEKLLPSPPTPQKALARALRALAGGNGVVRASQDGEARAVMAEEYDGEGLPELHTTWSVEPDAQGTALVFKGTIDEETREMVECYFDRYRKHFVSGDFGALCKAMMKACNGLPVRDRGGLYYIPPCDVAMWCAMGDALESTTLCIVEEIPAMRSDRATAAMVRSLVDETTKEMRAVEDYIDGGEFTTKGINARTRKLEEQKRRVQAFAEVLGPAVNDLMETLRDAAAGLSEARLAVEAEQAAK